LAGIGDDRGVGPVSTTKPGDLSGDHGRPHGQKLGEEAGLFVRFADRRLLRGLVAVAGTAGQSPGAALMAPRRAMLKQHRRGAVRPRGSQQQTGRAISTPIVDAAVGYHPSVTVALHEFRICSPAIFEARGQLRPPPPMRPNILLVFAYRGSHSD